METVATLPASAEQRERLFFLSMAIAIAVTVVVAFSLFYVAGISSFGAPWWVHVHGLTFVAWIVFHEMLHQVHDADVVGGRRRFHTRAFVDDEARFEHYVLARRWERQNLDALLTY